MLEIKTQAVRLPATLHHSHGCLEWISFPINSKGMQLLKFQNKKTVLGGLASYTQPAPSQTCFKNVM